MMSYDLSKSNLEIWKGYKTLLIDTMRVTHACRYLAVIYGVKSHDQMNVHTLEKLQVYRCPLLFHCSIATITAYLYIKFLILLLLFVYIFIKG